MAPHSPLAPSPARPARPGHGVAVLLVVVALGTLIETAPAAVADSLDRPLSVVAVRRPEGATVRWHAKVNVPDGAFRLYVTDERARDSLVAELPASMHQRAYQLRGLRTRGERVDLRLAFVGRDGREVELALLVAQMASLGPDESVTLSPRNQMAAHLPQTVEVRRGSPSPRDAVSRRATPHAWRSPPPTPPPEAA